MCYFVNRLLLLKVNKKGISLAKKLITTKSHIEQVNLALAYVHFNFNKEISAEDLANICGYSIFHFHRIFKEVTDENINDYIRNTRLEKASNLLLYNQHQTIEMIAINSGFASASGFRRAFKQKFGVTPKEWRKSGYTQKDLNCPKAKISMIQVDDNIDVGTPIIVNNEPIPMLFMLTYGYKDDMSAIWNHIYEWSELMGVLEKEHRFIGLFHNHPSFEPYDTARYVACVETNDDVFRSGKVGKCVISKGKFAKFEFTCTHKELYEMMHIAYTKWLPTSEYEVRNFPAYVEYKNIDSLLNNGILECDFYMPIQLIV